uniref:Putative conserved secreted protein n=1 Tax=Xenopsylla cheopis TaxID=163159 RepID=A0A6M2DWF2_XENCH
MIIKNYYTIMGIGLVLISLFVCFADGQPLSERGAELGVRTYDQNYQNGAASFNEYPIVVPKRAALLLDRLLVALQSAMDEEQAADIRNRMLQFDKPNSILNDAEEKIAVAGLQRRGSRTAPSKGRYWKCYFNAVTCF